MKEKIIEICKIVEVHIQKSEEYQACIGMGYFTERFNEVLPLIEAKIASEVDRIIEERMPKNHEIMAEFEKAYGYLSNPTKRQIWRHSLWAIELFQYRIKGKQ